jgi:hypothetical protein
MFGNTRRETVSYACNPKKAYRLPGHPVTTRVREDHLLSGLTRFLVDNIFGPYRHGLLDASHTAVAREAKEERAGKVKVLQKAITDTSTKSSRLIRTPGGHRRPRPGLHPRHQPAPGRAACPPRRP